MHVMSWSRASVVGLVAVFALGARSELEPPPQPAPCSRHLAGLVGAYGQTNLPVYVFEREGKLYLLSAGAISGPLEEPSSDVFTVPAPGLTGGFDPHLLPRSGWRRGRGTRGQRRPGPAVPGDRGTRDLSSLAGSAGRRAHPGGARRAASARAREPAQARPRGGGPLDPTLKLDIRYATRENFLGVPVYSEARAFLQRPAAQALIRAHRALSAFGYGLLIHDAYRPWYVTKVFWEATPVDKREFVADPAQGSRHNRGCAVDLTLYDRGTGKAVEMPGVYDEMSRALVPDLRRRDLGAAVAARPPAKGDGAGGLHGVRSRVVALRLPRLEELPAPEPDLRPHPSVAGRLTQISCGASLRLSSASEWVLCGLQR